MARKKPAQPNQSLIDGLECLEAVALSRGPIGVREMARMLDLEPTRVSRLLGTLAYLGLTEKTEDRKYAPGSGIHVLSAMGLNGSNLLNAALPVVQGLVAKHKLSVAVGVRWRRHVCYFFHGGPNQPIEKAIAGNQLYPAERSSIGRVFLSAMTKEEVRALLAGDPELDMNKLLRDLSIAHRNGYSLSADGNSLAAPIGDEPIAGIAFSNIGRRAVSNLVRHLQDAAEEIAQSLNKD